MAFASSLRRFGRMKRPPKSLNGAVQGSNNASCAREDAVSARVLMVRSLSAPAANFVGLEETLSPAVRYLVSTHSIADTSAIRASGPKNKTAERVGKGSSGIKTHIKIFFQRRSGVSGRLKNWRSCACGAARRTSTGGIGFKGGKTSNGFNTSTFPHRFACCQGQNYGSQRSYFVKTDNSSCLLHCTVQNSRLDTAKRYLRDTLRGALKIPECAYYWIWSRYAVGY